MPQHLTDLLNKYSVDRQEVEALATFHPRDGFIHLAQAEQTQILEVFASDRLLKDVVPVMTNGHSNYVCLYASGPLTGKVCQLDHEETSIEPRFKSCARLIKSIEEHPEAWDIDEIPKEHWDYPPTREQPVDELDLQAIGLLRTQIKAEQDPEVRTQLILSVMALTAYEHLESLVGFLDDVDMFVQERAISLLGWHRYPPARERIRDLQTTAQHNGRLAAKLAIQRFREAQ